MQVGIITFHRAINYGAVLQAYALTKVINSLGDKSRIIDYIAPCVSNRHKPLRLSLRPSEIYRYLRYGKSVNERFNNFQNFLNTIPITVEVSKSGELSELAQHLNAVICGSDQVWNTEITSNDFHYFLDFVSGKVKKIAYAASFGITHIPENVQEEIKLNLNKFDSISVREEEGADLVERLIGKRPQVTLDPTILISADEWREISTSEKLPPHYVLIYSVGEVEKLFPLALEISHSENIPIVIFSHRNYKELDNVFYIRTFGPTGFINAFDKADYVVTNSFHGTAFSVIFHKKFIVLSRTVNPLRGSGINSRINTLLKKSGLDNQIYHGGSLLSKLNNINYSEVEERLNPLREKSIGFLIEALHK